MTLQEVMDFIGSKYVFSGDNYPRLPMKVDRRLAFVVNHSHLHMSKSLGKIATELEIGDHLGYFPHQSEPVVREATIKMFINTLKLAQELGMTAEDLMSAVPEVMKSK